MENKAPQLNPFQRARIKFRAEFGKGIKPVDGRQPIADELAAEMVAELVSAGVSKDAQIGVVDAFLILSTHLKEAGFTNLTVLEKTHGEVTKSQETYYNNVKILCGKSGIVYYVPPMNNYNRCDMKFDVVIGNPPYQQESGGGAYRGSTSNPLWFQFTKDALKLLKDGGILSFITPTGMFEGGAHFTAPFFGPKREYDLKTVDFNADDSFSVGIDICRWTATNTKTEGNTCTVNDGRVVDTDTAFKVTRDAVFSEILNTMFNSDKETLVFDTRNRYDFQNVERELAKQGLPTKWAKDLKLNSDETHKFPININGTIKYSRVEWKNRGIWRLFIAKMKKLSVEISKEWEADGCTFTMVFDSEDDALRTQSYLSDPRYSWIIENTRLNGRLNGTTISALPNAPIEEVLTEDQLSYIDSHL